MPPAPDSLMLFAAGFGTRMGGLTEDRPKPLLRVGGRALIDHALGLADDAAVARIVVNLHYRGGMIEKHLADRPDILFSAETDTILETGGGLKHALPLLGPDPVLTLNTDAVWSGPNPLTCLRAAWDPDRMDALLMVLPRDRATGHTGRGDFAIDAAGRLTRGTDFVYSGAQVIRTDAVAAVPAKVFSLNRVWDLFAATGRLFGCVYPGEWCDVGQPSSLMLAEALSGRAAHG